jgi:hypothetical protein
MTCFAACKTAYALIVIDEHGRFVEAAHDPGMALIVGEIDHTSCDYRSHEIIQVEVDEDGNIDGHGVLEHDVLGRPYCVLVIDLALVGLGRAEGLSALQTAQQMIAPCPQGAGDSVRELHERWQGLVASGQEPRVW